VTVKTEKGGIMKQDEFFKVFGRPQIIEYQQYMLQKLSLIIPQPNPFFFQLTKHSEQR
jgi:hypothetical protein